MDPRGFAAAVVEVAQERQQAVFHGAQMEMILELDGLHRQYQEQTAEFLQYYLEAAQLHTTPAQLRQFGLSLVMSHRTQPTR
jgi:hypothetical protein